jgi:hypothetical protein
MPSHRLSIPIASLACKSVRAVVSRIKRCLNIKLPKHLIGTCYYIKGCAGIKGFVAEEDLKDYKEKKEIR